LYPNSDTCKAQILSENTNKLDIHSSFSTILKDNTTSLNPHWISGFADGECTFHVSIYKNNKYKTGWSVIPGFSIGLAIKDLPLLYQIKSYFETGIIVINEKNGSAFYSVKSIKDLINIIIPHFDRYPLITRKWIDYELFKLA